MNDNFIVKKAKNKIIVNVESLLKVKNKKEEIKQILKDISRKEIKDVHILSTLEVFETSKNSSIEFNDIVITKKGNNVIFKRKNKWAFLWYLLFFIFSLLICLSITIYWAKTYYKKLNDNNKTCDKCNREKKQDETEERKNIIKGDSILNITSGGLIITYKNSIDNNVIPDDMKYSTPIKESTITIENTSDSDISYDLVWNIIENNFESDNFKYLLTSTNGGANTELQTVPKENKTIVSDVNIKAQSTQIYTLSFRLVGINKPQDEDQNKKFNGKIDIKINQQ